MGINIELEYKLFLIRQENKVLEAEILALLEKEELVRLFFFFNLLPRQVKCQPLERVLVCDRIMLFR